MRFCYVSGGIARGFFFIFRLPSQRVALREISWYTVFCYLILSIVLIGNEVGRRFRSQFISQSRDLRFLFSLSFFLSFFCAFVSWNLWTGCRIVPDYSGERTRTDSSQRPTGHTRPDEFQSLDGFHPIRIGRYGRQREPLHGSGRSLIQTHRTDARPLRGLQLPARVVHSAFRRRPVFIIFFFFTFFEINKQLRKERIFVVGN